MFFVGENPNVCLLTELRKDRTMAKMIKVEKCGECPNCYSNVPTKPFICGKTQEGKQVYPEYPPPDWCPLPDAPEPAPKISEEVWEECQRIARAAAGRMAAQRAEPIVPADLHPGGPYVTTLDAINWLLAEARVQGRQG